MSDIFDSIGNVFDRNPNEHVESYPTTQEIRDKNYDKMFSTLLQDGYGCTEHIVRCIDGEEYEITEIRGPKASGFFFAENYGLRASDFFAKFFIL